MIDINQILMILDQLIPATGGFPGLMGALVFIRDLLTQFSGGGLPTFPF